MSAPAEYEIEEIMDALAERFHGLDTGDTLGGSVVELTAYATVPGNIEVPALVLELDDIAWDLNMGDGADGLSVVASCYIQAVDSKGAQRAMWRFLSRKSESGVGRLKAALEEDATLGGLVSFAHMTNARRIGQITYDGIDYLGAELIIEVVS
jgi:hypothetical protein